MKKLLALTAILAALAAGQAHAEMHAAPHQKHMTQHPVMHHMTEAAQKACLEKAQTSGKALDEAAKTAALDACAKEAQDATKK